MYGKGNKIRKLTALFLAVCMLISPTGMTAFAETPDYSGESAAAEETAVSVSTEQADAASVIPAQETGVDSAVKEDGPDQAPQSSETQDKAKAAEKTNETQSSEVQSTGNNDTAQSSGVKNTEKTDAGQSSEENVAEKTDDAQSSDAQSKEKTDTAQASDAKAAPKTDETQSSENSEGGVPSDQKAVRMPAQSIKAETDEMEVVTSWEENIFPEDVTMVVRKANSEQIKAAAQELTGDDAQVVDVIAVDITFYTFTDGKRMEIQPADPAGVHVKLKTKRAVAGEEYTAIHVGDDGEAELVADATARGAAFDSVGFSVYAIIGTDGKQASDTTRRTYIFKVEGEEVARQTVKNGDTLIEPATPVAHEPDNYFIGWFLENGTELSFGTVSGIADAEQDEEVIVNARFFEEFTVTFFGKAIDGERPILEIETGDTGDTVSTAGITPQALSGSEELIGWSKSENATEATYGLNEEITIADYDMSLYPVIRSVRKIEFNGNGGEDHVTFTEPLTVVPGNTATKPADPERAGYTFKGWYTNAACSQAFNWNQAIAAGEEPIVLYAGWDAKTVQYEVYVWGEVMNDDGTSEYAVEKNYFDTAVAGTEFTQAMITASYNKNITSDVFDNNYYTLNTGKTSAQYGTKVKGDGSSIFNIYYDLKEFEFYFLQSQAKDNMTYTITVNGETITPAGTITRYAYHFKAKLGQNIDALWPTSLTYTGSYSTYAHTGWQFTRNNSSTSGGVNPIWVTNRHTLTKQSINTNSSGVPYETTYFRSRAVAKNSTTTANFLYFLEGDDGTYPSTPDARFTQRNTTVETSSVDAQKEIAGYKFERLDKSGNTYNFYYSRVSYDINFHNYNVEDPGGATDIKFGSDISSFHHTPNKDQTGLEDYYEFQGWYTDRQYQNEWTFAGDEAKMPSHNLTLYAYWKAKDITITLDKGDGTTKAITTTAGSTIEEPAAERDGLIFDGWYLGSTKVDFENRVFENDTTLVARWISGQVYKVRYEDEFPDHPKAKDESEYRLGSHILVLALSDDVHETGTFHGYRLRGQSDSSIYTPGYILSFDSLDLLDSDGYITFDAVHTHIPSLRSTISLRAIPMMRRSTRSNM